MKWNPWARYFFFNGADQLALYSARYYLLYALFAALLACGAGSWTRAAGGARAGFWDACGIPLQLYLAAGMASVLLPSIIALPQYQRASVVSDGAALFGVGNSGVLDAGRDEAEEVARDWLRADCGRSFSSFSTSIREL